MSCIYFSPTKNSECAHSWQKLILFFCYCICIHTGLLHFSVCPSKWLFCQFWSWRARLQFFWLQGDYAPQPADLHNVTLTRGLLEMAEHLAENSHDSWAQMKEKQLDALGMLPTSKPSWSKGPPDVKCLLYSYYIKQCAQMTNYQMQLCDFTWHTKQSNASLLWVRATHFNRDNYCMWWQFCMHMITEWYNLFLMYA